MDTTDVRKLVASLSASPAVEARHAAEVRAADIAAMLPDIEPEAQEIVLSLLGDAKAAEVLVETDEATRARLVERLEPERLARLVDEMDPDDAADVLALVPEETRAALLSALPEDQRRQVRALGAYDPDSAGGIMTTEFVAVGSNESVGSALSKVRSAEQEEATGSLFVVDPAGTLVGVVSLRDLLSAEPGARLGDVMDHDVISVPVEADQEEAARTVEKYRLNSLPVVDGAGRLKGVITLDDIVDVLGEEATEDVLVLAGTSALHPTKEPVLRRFLARSPWLAVTLTGSFSASLLLEYAEGHWFGRVLDEVPSTFRSLLYFIPLIGGMAGNVGSQSSATMVRGFATGEVDEDKPMRVLPRELILGLMIGIIAGVLVGCVVAGTHPEARWLGLVVGLALPCSITMAALSGTIIPFLCARLGVDPAYASGPFLQTMNDLTGYLIYFAVALALMHLLGLG